MEKAASNSTSSRPAHPLHQIFLQQNPQANQQSGERRRSSNASRPPAPQSAPQSPPEASAAPTDQTESDPSRERASTQEHSQPQAPRQTSSAPALENPLRPAPPLLSSSQQLARDSRSVSDGLSIQDAHNPVTPFSA